MKNKLKFLIVGLACVSLILSACGGVAPATATVAPVVTEAPVVATEAPTAAPTATPEPKGPLTVLIDNDEGPITPANFNTFIGFWLVGWVYDSLYIRTPELEPIPSLATSATPSADGLTWTVTLREGVKWHDG
ncbi:MAG TPA: ABC transporter substrate-binding protein, partial [Anaerolineales bacterium]|nr:ABC transporter substrate-binding protein [Anaerolineales bacterium]